MYHRPEVDVLVVGAGPVGMLHALALIERGAGVRIVEEEWRPAARSYALTLHPGALEILDDLGLAERVISRGLPIERVAFYDERGRRAELKLSELAGRFPFALVLPQSELEEILEKRLQELGSGVRWNERLVDFRVEGGFVVAEVGRLAPTFSGRDVSTTRWTVDSTYQVRPQFLIGADGSESRVRRILGIDYEFAGDPERYAVFEFECDAPQERETRIVLDGSAASVLWPLPDRSARWSFQLPDSDPLPAQRSKARDVLAHRAFEQLDVHLLSQLVEKRAPWFAPRPRAMRWSTVVRFERRLVSRFGRGHVWLAGDAAHQTGPIGVQSMNVALREARDLVQAMMEILSDRASLDALEDYNADRLSEWRGLLGVEDKFHAPAPPDDWIARHRARILPCVPASGSELGDLLGQIGITTAGSRA
jgi:2-polyprenyl-6-methoxyphenol hydroxylase-like FAD-dependent oxidoreductase